MKRLGIMIMTALLATASGYVNAQQPPQKDLFPPPSEPVEEYKFPENPKPEEFKFPEKPPVEKMKSPMEATQSEDQKAKEEQAQALKTYSPKEKKAYLNKTATDLTAIQKRIDNLDVKEEYKTLQRRNSNRMMMVDLQKKALNARKRLASLEKATEMAWSAEKFQMDRAMGEVKKAFSGALEFFEEKGSGPQGPKAK